MGGGGRIVLRMVLIWVRRVMRRRLMGVCWLLVVSCENVLVIYVSFLFCFCIYLFVI